MDRTRRSGPGAVTAVVFLAAISIASLGTIARAQDMGQQALARQLSDVTAIELIPGLSSGTFTLLIRCPSEREYNWFLVRERTVVMDIHNTYMPFRGHALGELSVPGVSAVRASQFMEGPIPVARIEVDIGQEMSVDARWSEAGLEVMFGPPGPTVPAPTLARRPDQPVGRETAAEPTPPPVETPPPAAAETAPADTTRRILYNRAGRENPFDPLLKPLVDIDYTNTLTRPLPDAEQLSLEGIAFVADRPDLCVAQVRDSRGMHYHLRQGDRVRFGYVVSVGPDEVVFQLDIYGRQKEVRLKR